MRIRRSIATSAFGALLVAVLAAPSMSHAASTSDGLWRGFAAATSFPSQSAVATPGALPESPNVLLVVSDDQRFGTELTLPTIRKELIDRGVRFTDAVVPTSWCCPSRASLLTGRYSHGTGVWENSTSVPYGGWPAFIQEGEPQTLATALSARGYRTGLFGKYLNGLDLSAVNYAPPGWDRFVAMRGSGNGYTEFPTNDGVRHTSSYSTDFFAEQAVEFIEQAPPANPVFVYFSPFAPHSPYTAGPYAGSSAPYLDQMFRDTAWPSPTFLGNPPAGKPPWMKNLDPQAELSARVDLDLQDLPRAQQDALMGVDAAVGNLLGVLERTGRLENTLIVFLSDNGYSWGEFGLIGKNTPYRGSIEVPLLMRWDAAGLTPKSDDRLVAANIDAAATILAATGTTLPNVDGLSLFASPARPGVLLEAAPWRGEKRRPAYCGWRSSRYLYVRYDGGFEELYDYAWDPYEQSNVASLPVYASVVNDHRNRAHEECGPLPPGFAWE